MNSIDKLLSELCPNGVEYLPFSRVGTFSRGGGPQKKDFRASGIGCIHYGQIYTFYGTAATETNKFVSPDVASKSRMANPGDVVIAVTGENDEDLARAVAWLGEEPVAVSNHTLIFTSSLEPRFVSYFLRTSLFDRQKRRYITGTKVRSLPERAFDKIRIPVPPLEIQQEIANILDAFTKLEAQLEAELELRTQQYEYYRRELLTPSISSKWSSLGAISLRVSSGATPKAGTPRFYENGTIPWLRTAEVSFGEIWDTEVKITEQALQETGVSWIEENCVIVAISGATAARSAVNMVPLTTNQHCCNLQIDPVQADYRYVFHWVSSRYEELKLLGRGARGDLNAKIIKDFPIALPPLEEQRRIVNILDKFDALVNDISTGLPAEIEGRRQQYEYYRDRLLTFKELEMSS